MTNRSSDSEISLVERVMHVLFKGDSVRLTFPSKAEAEYFRQRLYKYKKSQDKIMETLLGEQKKILRVFKKMEVVNGNVFVCEMRLVDEDPRVKDWSGVKFEILPSSIDFDLEQEGEIDGTNSSASSQKI